MFEGKPPIPAEAEDRTTPAVAVDELRVLSWNDLVARLSAARDLRVALAASNEEHAASFDAHSARHLAARNEDDARNINSAVNPVDSGNRKGTGGTNSARNKQHRPVTRGNT